MANTFFLSASVLGCYLIGAIPFSFLIPKVFLGLDIRDHGSGNPGASNVARVCGKPYGIGALILDVGKGAASVFLLTQLGFPPLLGSFAVLGHVFNPFFGFSGGKGVATSLGVISYLSWLGGLVFVLIWATTFLLWRIAGLSSLLGISSTPVVFGVLGEPRPMLWASLGLLALVFFTHRENIQRLIQGKERKV